MKEVTHPLLDCPVHPVSAKFPLMDAVDLGALAEDIRKNGILQPIVYDMREGVKRILDGRNRYIACHAAQVEPRWVRWDENEGRSKVAFVVSANIHRRHLTPAQRALLATECVADFTKEAKERKSATYRRNFNNQQPDMFEQPDDNPRLASAEAHREDEEEKGKSSEKVAEAFDVGHATVERMLVVKEHGIPEVAEAVKDGKIGAATAERIARATPEHQAELLDEAVNRRAGVEGIESEEDKVVERDPAGNEMPEQAQEAFKQRHEFKAICNIIRDLRRRLKIINHGPAGRCLEFRELDRDLENLHRRISDRKPAYCCPYCWGNTQDPPCTVCRNSGWVQKIVWYNSPAGEDHRNGAKEEDE